MRAERLAALALAAALAGCAHAPQRPSAAAAGGAPPPGAGEERQALALLAWLETARALGPDARAREARRLEAALEPGRCAPARVRLAALALEDADAEGAGRARAVLAPCLGPPDDGHGAAVRLVAAALARLADARLEAARARADLAAAEARNATLERQLEALKDIERSIRERGRAAGNGRRGDGTRTRPSR